MLVSVQQGADLLFRGGEVDMFDVMARRHDAADRALVKIEHPLNHQPLLRVEDLPVTVIGQHRGRFSIQLRIFFLPAEQAHHRVGGALT